MNRKHANKVTSYVKPNQKSKVEELSRKSGKSVSCIVAEFISDGLKKEE